MKNVKVGKIDDVSIVGFDLHIKTSDGKKEVISDGVVSLLKGSLVLEGNDGNPLSRADIFGKTNLQVGSSVLVPEFLSSESGKDEVERKDTSGKEKKEELSDEQIKELKKKMEELKKLKDDLEKQQKELKEKEKELEDKEGEQDKSGEDPEAVEEIIQQLEESIQAMANAATAATAASETQQTPAPPAPADENTSKKKGVSDGAAASSSSSAPPVEEEEEDTKIFVEVSLSSRSDSGDKDDFITNKNAPSFEIKTLPNAAITLIINGTTYTAKADGNGNAIINVDELADGVYVVNVEAMDGSGSTSTVAEVIIDTVPPEATLALSTDSGKFDDDFITNVNKPTFVGTLSGDPTEVILDIGELSFIIPAKNGDFTYALTDVIPDGEYDAILTAIDAAGNETVIKQKVIIDTVNEFSVQIADSSDSGEKGDWITNSLSPTFTFDHEVGASIQIILNGQLYDDIVVNETPPSTYTFDPPLGVGLHVLSFISVDLAGNKSTIEKTLDIDITPPEFEFKGLTAATDTGGKGDLITGNTKPFFEGRGEPGSKIYLTLAGKPFEPIEVDKDGKWFIDLGILEEDSYNFIIYAQDKAGNQSPHVTDTLVIDTTGPVISGGLTASTDLGHFNNDGVTSADDLLFEVTTEAGIQVFITIPELGIEEQLLIEDPDGVYTINCENVPVGTYTYSITAVDRAGNPSKNNLTGNILVDRTIENFSANLKASSDSGFEQDDNLTKETLLEVEGTGEAGSKINLSVQQRDENENLIPTFDHGPEYVKEDGTWSFYLPAHLLEGAYLLTFTITDIAGNEKSIETWITIDKQASLSAKLFVDANDADTEVVSLDGLTNKPSLEFSGSADAGSRISILLRHPGTNEQIVFEDFYADANGNWKAVFPNGQTLSEQGEWVWTISAEDPAGNLATNVTGNFVFDNIPPEASISLSSTAGFNPTHTNDTALDFSVTSEVGSTVQVVVYELINGVANTLNPAYQSNPPVLVSAGGPMSYTLPQLSEGKYVYFVIATDPAGNVTQTPDQFVTIDTTLPPLGDIMLTAASDTNIVGDYETYDTTLTFSGSGAEAGTKMNITIQNEETQIYVKPDPQFDITDPNWVFELPELEHGTYVITFQTEDAAGNRSTETQEFTITIDTEKPPLNEVSLETGNVSGNHFVTKEEHPVFIGKADVGDTITISLYVDVDGKRTFWSSKTDVVPDGNGGWRIQFTDIIPDGKYFWTITAIDVAGNVSEMIEDDQTLLVDSVYETGTASLDDSTNSGSKADNVTNFTSPVISGSGEPHTSVQLTALTGPGPLFESIDVTGVPIATLNEDGEWQLTLPNLDKGEGVYTYTVTFTDAAGNSQPVTNTITLDTVTTIEGKLETDTGTLDSDGLTKDSTPTFGGTGEPKADLLLTLIHNATKEEVTVPGKVLDNGTWSITVPDVNALSEGEWTWKVTATDLAGNIGYTPEGGITIDTSAPIFTEHSMVDTGAFIPDGEPPSINNPSPNFTGKVTEIGGYVTVVIFPVYAGVPSGNPMHTSPPATAGGEGQFTLPIGTVLGEGEYQWQLVVTDAAGNKTETPKQHFVVDLTRPEFTADYDDEFSVNQVDTIYYTNDHEFSFSGTAGSPTQSEVGTRINITLTGPSGPITLEPAFATVGADGNWSYTVDSDAAAVVLANPGLYTWSFQAQDAAGNTSELSQSGSIKLDITPPVPTFTGLGNDENGDSTDTGNSSTDWLTNADKPVFTGTVDEDATITVTLTPAGSGQPIILTVQAVAGQTWQVAPSLTIPVGTYDISITATDNAGNTNDPPLTFEKDLVIDRGVTGGTVDDIGLSTETDSGLKEDETTNSRAPTIHGEVEVGTRVELVSLFAPAQPPNPSQNLVQVGDNYFDIATNGEFTLTLPSLVGMPEGEYTYTLKYIDPAGNEDTVTHKFTLDTTIDVTAVFDSDTGTNGTLLYTNEDVVSFSGTGLDGDKVTLTITPPNGAPALTLEAVYVDATNTWRIPNIDLTAYGEGLFTWNVEGVDPSGNEDLVNSGSFFRDKTPPKEGNISISPVGFESTHTNDSTPTFTITGEIGAKVSISVWYESKGNGLPFTVTDLELENVNGDGQLVYTFPNAFTNQGNYVCEVIVTDFAGNSTTYPLETIKVDTILPNLTTQIELDDLTTVGGEGYTNDKALSFTGAAGSAEVGTRIYLELFVGEAPNQTPVSGITPPFIEVENIDGSWTYTLNSAFTSTLEDDDYTWSFYSLDSAGNISDPPVTGNFVLDTRLPVPSFTGLGRNPDNSSTDTGTSDTDLITNNQRPIISGTVNEPSIITVTLTRVGEPTITLVTEQPVNGSWSLTPLTDLDPGSYTINIVATDNAGNVSSTVTHPDPLVIDRDVEGGDVGSFGLTNATDSGTDENDDITNNPNPVLEGTVEIGTSVEVTSLRGPNGIQLIPASNNPHVDDADNGSWQISLPSLAGLPEGVYFYTLKYVDVAGNEEFKEFSFTYDASINIEINFASESGSDGTNIYANVNPVRFSGTGDAGDEIILTLTPKNGSAIVLDPVTVDELGNWFINSPLLSDQGEYSWSITVTDTAGNRAPAADNLSDPKYNGSFILDTVPPQITEMWLDESSQTGFSPTHTNHTTPTLHVKGEVGAKITIQLWLDGSDPALGHTATDIVIQESGIVNHTFTDVLGPGTYKWQVTITDVAGNSLPSEILEFVLDTTLPNAPVVNLNNTVESDEGVVYLTEKTVSFSGTAIGEANSRVELVLTKVGSSTPLEFEPNFATVDASGNWTFTLNPAVASLLEEVEYNWSFVIRDQAGNVSTTAATGSFTVDTIKPEVTFTGLGLDGDDLSTDTGDNASDLITKAENPVFTGTVTEDATITISLTKLNADGVATSEVITLTDKVSQGSWSITSTGIIPEGKYHVSIVATDPAGNVTDPALVIENPLVIDRNVVGGEVPEIGLHPDSNSGDKTDQTTNEDQVTISGTVEAGSTVELISLRLKNPDGTLGPLISLVGVDTDEADDDGNWSITLPSFFGLEDGVYQYTVNYTDVAGNQKPVTHEFIRDTSVDITVNFDNPTGDSDENLTYCNLDTATFSGTGTDKDIITITLTGTEPVVTLTLDPITVGADGIWNTPNIDLSQFGQGNIIWTVYATDPSGNVNTDHSGVIIRDTIPPQITEIYLDQSSQTGFSPTHTSDTTPTLHVKGEAGAKITIQLWLDGSDPALGHTATDIVIPESGIVKHTFTDVLAPGTYKWQVTITDVAGNSVPSEILEFVVDTTLPNAPVVNLDDAVESDEGDVYLTEKTVSFSGTAVGEANSRVELVLTKVGSTTPLEFEPNFATVDASGNWTFTLNSAVASALEEAEYNWSFVVRDQAGNVSTTAATGSFTVDTIVPEVTFTGLGLGGDGLSTDTGDDASDLITYAENPVFTGSVTEDATITIKLTKLNANGVATSEVITLTEKVSQGNWSITSTGIIPEGTYRVSITATDPAGNVNNPPLVTENSLVIDRNVMGGDSSEIGLHPDTNSGDKTDQTTNEDTVIISGTVEAGSTVELTALRLKNPDGTLGPLISLVGVGTDEADDDGNWSITLPSFYGLADGIYQYTVNYTDVAGNQKPVTHEFIRDTSVDITVNFDNATGDSNENVTYCNLDTATFSGTGTHKDIITITLRGEPAVTLTLDPITVGASGSWNTPNIDLSQFEQGNIVWTVYATDPSGNVNTDHSGVIFRDTVIPQFDSLGLSQTTQTGFDPTSTNSSNPTFAIDGEPGAKVTIKLWTGTTATGTPQTIDLVLPANGEVNAGYLEHTFANALGTGSYVWQVVMTDAAGNVNPSQLQNLLIDKTIPTITSSVIDDTTNGHYVNHSPVILSGTGEAHSRVYITLIDTENQQNVSIVPDFVTVDANGNWSFSLELNDGSYSWEIKAIDGAGNESTPVTGNVVKDMQPPTPTFSGLDRLPNDDGIVSDSGTLGDNTTKETRPSFTGTVDELSEITITITSIDGSTEHVITSDGFITGAWTIDYNAGAALTHGDYTVTVTAIDYAGNSTTIPAEGDPVFDLFIDTEVENFTIRLDEDSDSGVDNADNKTNQTVGLQVSGTGEDGATVEVSEIQLDGVVIDLTGYTLVGSVVAGNWHITLPDFTPDPPFGEGVYDIKVMMTDKAGNEKELTTRFTVDLTPPVVEGGLKQADEDGENGSDSGSDPTDGVTNVPNPVLAGTVSEASRLVITITGGTTQVPSHTITEINGAWEYQLPTLENGTYTWTVTATDLAGNQHSDTGTITIDRTPPNLSFAIDAEDITGGTNEHPLANLEDETFVTFGGTVTLEQANTPIKVQFVIRNTLGAAVVDEEIFVTNGERFTFEFTPPEDGTYTWDIIVTDLAGNESTDDGIITIDTAVTPFTNIEYADGFDTGASSEDGITNNPRLSITGNTEGFANLQLIILNSSGEKVVDYSRSALEDGSFSMTVPDAQKLVDPGVYTWTLTATDAAGNTLTTDPPVSFTFDNQPPVITEITLDEGTLGSSPNDLITKNKQPSFSGKTDDNATDVKVTIVKLPNNEDMGSDSVTPANGVWTYTHATELLDGTYKAQIESIDAAGNRFYDEVEFIIDNAIVNIFELTSDYGIEGDQITNAKELVFKGTTDPDATLTFSMFHKEPDYFMQTFTPHINNETGEWEFTVEQELPEGQYDFIFTTTDLAGNESVSEPYTVTIDRTDPILLNVKLAPESDTDEQGDWSTETKAVKIIGTTEPGAFITIVIPDLNISYGPNETQQHVDSVTGAFWIQLPELNFGYYDILIVATDAAGNTATVSETLHIDSGFVPFTVGIADADDSGVKEDNVTSNTTPLLTGTITPGYQLTLIIDGERYPATISDRGIWEVEITPTLTEDKVYTVSFEIFDHDNALVSQDDYTFTLDTSANVLVRLHQSSDSGDKNDFITNAHDIIVEFNADPGSKLKLYNVATNPPTLIDQTTVALSGRWNYEFNGLGEGEHNFKVEIEDPAGNTDYQEFDIKVDRVAPTFTDLSYGGKEYGPTLVFDAHSQTITGRYAGDEDVTITLTNDGKNVTFTFDETTGQFTANIVLKEGMNNLVLTITDEAGNSSSYNTQVTAKTVMTFQMDVLDKNGNVDLDGELSDDKITLKGVGYPGDILNISIVKKGGATYTIPEFTVDESGNWTKQLTGLTDGEYTITVHIEDIAGNTDTRDPVTVVLDTAYFDFSAKLDDSSGDTTDNLVNTSTPRFSGTGEAGTSIFVLVGGRTYTAATVTDGGVWTFNLPVELDEGESTITIWAIDTAGNKSVESEFTVKVDTVIAAPTFTVTGVYEGDDGRHYINSKEGTNSHPTLSGSFSEQGTMTLAINGALYTAIYDLSDPDNTNDSWSFDVTGLPDGFTYNYTLTFTDLAGNSKPQNGMITVDKTINVSYRIMEEYDSNLLDKVTNSREMGFNFTGTDADVTFNVSVTGPGNYTYERNNIPAVGDYLMEGSWETDGDYVFTFDFKDPAGNTWSQTFTIELDTQIDDLNAGDFSYDGEAFGIEDNIIYTNEETITIKYTPPPGAEYVRFEGKVDNMPGYPDGTQNEATGIWSIPSLNLVPGNNVISLFAWDLAGNDTVIQVEVFYIPNIGNVTLNIDGEAITNLDDPIPNLYSNEENGQLTLSGTVAAGTEITITLNGIQLPSFEALESSDPLIPGEWSTTLTLNEGPNTIKISMVDVAGNEKEIDFATILDTTDPIIMFDEDEGFVGEGYQLIDGVHTITGSELDIKGLVDSGSSITGVTLNGGVVDASDLIINGSKWELNLSGLTEGANTVIISAIDTAGNTIDKTININKDTSVTELELNRMPANDEVFNTEEAPRFSGTVEEGSQVFIHVTNVDTGVVESFPATVRDDGSFTAYVFDLEGGNYTWTIEAIDAAGNTLATPSVGAATGSFIIDDEVENFSASYDGASLENGNMPAFSGTVEEGSKVVVTLTNEDVGGDYPCQVTINGGNWSAIASNLPTGNYSWEITATDPAGNVDTISSENNIAVDTSVDNFQANLVDDGDGVVTALPTFSGSVEESSTVTILLVDKEDPNTTYTITATVTGTTWTADASTVSGGIPDGDYTWQATATDSVGNTSTFPSSPENLSIDTSVNLFSVNIAGDADGDGDAVLNALPIFSGDVEASSTVIVVLTDATDSNITYTITATVTGTTWTADASTVPGGIPDGDYTWQATATDSVGHTSTMPDPAGNVSVDTGVNLFSANLVDPDQDGVVNTSPIFSGDVEASSTVIVVLTDAIDSNITYTITATVTGTTWTADASTVPGGIPDGDYTWQATATDSVGHTSTMPDPAGNVSIDTTPAVPSELSIMPNENEIGIESETATDTLPAYSTLSGSVEANASVVVKLVNNDTGEKQDVDAIVEGETWRVSMPDLVEGSYSWEAISTDVAGNVSTIMAESDFTYKKPDEIETDILEAQLHITEPSASKDLTDEIMESKVFNGTSEPESSVKITIGDNVYEAQSDQDGDWVIKVNFDSPNTYDYQIEYVDAVGQAQKETGSVTVNKVQITGDGVTSNDQENIESTPQNEKVSSTSSEATTPNIDTMPDDQDNHY